MNFATTSVPMLRTERLQLVGFEPRHFPAFAQMHANAETMRHVGDGQPLDRVTAWLHLAMLLGHWDLRGYGVWAVEESGKDGLVGRAGLFHPEGWDEPELSWMIMPSMRGLGLAAEAAGAALDYAFATLRFPRLISLVRPDNVASRKVALRLGGAHEDTIDFLGAPMDVFRYRRPTAAPQGATGPLMP
jgi:RimJ/RimL family protein N-acetyltransferase